MTVSRSAPPRLLVDFPRETLLPGCAGIVLGDDSVVFHPDWGAGVPWRNSCGASVRSGSFPINHALCQHEDVFHSEGEAVST